MDGTEHQEMGRLAWHSLSEETREAWNLSTSIPDDAPLFIRRQPQPASVEEKIGHYCQLLDLMGWRSRDMCSVPDFLLSNGKPVPHGGVSSELTSVWCDGEHHLCDAWGWRMVMRRFVPKLIDTFRQGYMEQAALYAGLLGHFLQDGSALGHLFPNQLFHGLAPQTGEAFVRYHVVFDQCRPVLKPAVPSLLGCSVPEVVFRLGILGEQTYRIAQQQLSASLNAARRGDQPELDRLAQPLHQRAVDQFASLLYTAARIGTGTVDASEANALAGFDLTHAVAHYVHPGRNYGPTAPVNHNIVNGHKVPLRADLGEGVVTVDPGLGMTSFSSIRYLLEPGAFSSVEGSVALSADYVEDQAPDMDVEFLIGLADDWYREQPMDLAYGPELREGFSCRLKPGQRAVPFSVSLANAQTLMFAVRPHPRLVEGTEVCWHAHVVLAHPRLCK